jgi:hypothetical protein
MLYVNAVTVVGVSTVAKQHFAHDCTCGREDGADPVLKNNGPNFSSTALAYLGGISFH